MKASNIQPDKNISMLLKGGPGLGKTIAASTFALYGKIWIAYFDKKTPVELFTFWTKMGRKDVLDNIDYTSYSASNANDYLNDLMKMSQRPGEYIAGITDSVTMLTAAAVNWSMGFRTAGGKKDSKATGNATGPAIIPDFDEYKVETSLVTQALDLCKMQPWFNIWTAHPLPQIRVEGQGTNVSKVTKESSIVTYGSKVAGIVPGNFTEIYHFARQGTRRVVYTESTGDDFAKTAYDLPMYFDIQDKFFAEVWKKLINESLAKYEPKKEVANEGLENAFASPITEQANTSKWKI